MNFAWIPSVFKWLIHITQLYTASRSSEVADTTRHLVFRLMYCVIAIVNCRYLDGFPSGIAIQMHQWSERNFSVANFKSYTFYVIFIFEIILILHFSFIWIHPKRLRRQCKKKDWMLKISLQWNMVKYGRHQSNAHPDYFALLLLGVSARHLFLLLLYLFQKLTVPNKSLQYLFLNK